MAREAAAMGAAVMEEVETVEVVMAVAVKEAAAAAVAAVAETHQHQGGSMVLCRVRAPREYTG